MKSTITFEHGENTCATEVGKFCFFFGSKGFHPYCTLYNTNLFDNQTGWIQRCEKCKQEFPPIEPKE